MHYIIPVGIMKMLMLQQMQQHLCETGSVTLMDFVKEGNPQTVQWPTNKGATNAAVLLQPR
jgi:hypothetical protein